MVDFVPSIDIVDGVPVVHAPLEAVATATLIFTVGARDETPRTAGVAHLIEHVVMRRVGRVAASHNASTDGDSIRFFVSGSAPQIADFLERVCAAVAWLPECSEDDIAPERVTIGTELGPGAETPVDGGPLTIRYGLTDLGLLGIGPVTYRSLPVGAVHDFAARHLHRGNAAVTITGTMPTPLRLPLPDGRSRPPREAPQPQRSDLPGWAPSPVAPVALDLVLACTEQQEMIVQACIEAALQRVLRTEQRLIYSVQFAVFGIDESLGHLLIALDPNEDAIAATAVSALDLVRAIATTGPDPVDFDHGRDTLLSGLEHTAALASWLEVVAVALARGREAPLLADAVRELQSVTPSDVQAILADALSSMIATVCLPTLPDETVEKIGLPLLANDFRHVPRKFGGMFGGLMKQSFEVLSPKWGRQLRGYSLFVSDEAIAEIGPDGVYEAELADVVLVGRSPNGLLSLVTQRGTIFHVQPSDWRDPKKWISRVVGRLDPAIFYERAS